MNISLLRHKAYQLRKDVIRATTQAGSGHPTSCLSAADIIATLFFGVMRYNPEKPHQANNDRFILSKGHAAPLLYAAYKQMGIVTDDQLMTLRQFDSVLEGHPTFRFLQAEVATGSLGCGLSNGVGMALAGQIDKKDYYTYVLLGDSECAEGAVWEAAELAAYYRTNKLIAIIDMNRLGQRGQTLHGHDEQKYAQKFKAFEWNAITVDGHNVKALLKAFKDAQESPDVPTVIIAKTEKGYGLESVQNLDGFHGKTFKPEQLDEVLKELQNKFSADVEYSGEPWEPQLPEFDDQIITCFDFKLQIPDFSGPEATRKSYGKAVTQLGSLCESVIVLDAEVKNSTFSELFETEHPQRFFECFLAEQNMVAMGSGMAARKKIPFISTFGAFFTRAFDQIRMAAIGKNPLRLVGSHCGVSIGQDGPSQMALEDLAMMRSIPDSIILYPCDAVSTFKCVELMANYYEGVSYLRTTRQETKNVHSKTEEFEIGGCSILKKNENAKCLLVAAGITTHEALKAAEYLEQQNILVSVIDAYSIKPLDVETIFNIARQSQNKVITIEDHYIQGGLGQSVNSALIGKGIQVLNLAVTEIPRSGTPKELRSWAGIDAGNIMETVKRIV
jgi:transketolase